MTTAPHYLESKWVLWSHNLENTDWTIKGYKRLAVIETLHDFWCLFNNVDKLGLTTLHYYLMKEGVTPTWEDERNKDGGICTFKVDQALCASLLENISAHIIVGRLLKDGAHAVELTGVSISPKASAKHKYSIVKVWNSRKRDISKLFCKEVAQESLGFNVQYKAHW